MSIEVGQLVEDIKIAVSEVVQQDITRITGFSERQVKAIAQQAALVEAGILNGQITDETRDFFLQTLKDMARNFAKVLHGLTLITIERVWNAVVGVVWRALQGATGIALPLGTP